MRSATILDVLHAVTRVARAHAEVESWWYAPPQRLRLAGELAPDDAPAPELAVEAASGQAIDADLLAREVRAFLEVPIVRVRPHRGSAEPRALFRLVTTRRDS